MKYTKNIKPVIIAFAGEKNSKVSIDILIINDLLFLHLILQPLLFVMFLNQMCPMNSLPFITIYANPEDGSAELQLLSVIQPDIILCSSLCSVASLEVLRTQD